MISVSSVTKELTNKVASRSILRNLFRPTYETKKVIDNVTLEVRSGDKIALMGRNGCGKSSLIKLLCGITQPTTGSIDVNGFSPGTDRKAVVQSMGVMFAQKSFLYPNLTLQDCIDLYAAVRGLDSKKKACNYQTLNSYFEISDFISSQVRTLSFGQRIRGELVCALIHNPSLIILDEPTIGIDVASKQLLHKFLKNSDYIGDKTVIITSHEPKIIKDFATRCVELDKGKIAYDGSMENYNLGVSIRLSITLKESISNSKEQAIKYDLNIAKYKIKPGKLDINFKPDVSEFIINQCLVNHVGLENIQALVRSEILYSEVK